MSVYPCYKPVVTLRAADEFEIDVSLGLFVFRFPIGFCLALIELTAEEKRERRPPPAKQASRLKKCAKKRCGGLKPFASYWPSGTRSPLLSVHIVIVSSLLFLQQYSLGKPL